MTRLNLEHKTTQANGITVHYVEQGVGFPVVLLHGFPENWHAWIRQLPALGNAGYHVIAPDLRGYGETDKPTDVEAYGIDHLVGDVVGLLDALGIERAVIAGHDWGGLIAWQTALAHPDRVERVVSLGTPYWPGGFPRERALADTHYLPDRWGAYRLDVDQPGRAEHVIGADLARWLEMIQFRRLAAAQPPAGRFPTRNLVWFYADSLAKGGLTGPINYFRNIRRNFEATEANHERTIDAPALLITGERDPICPPADSEGMDKWVPNLTTKVVTAAGRWVHHEMPHEVNAALLEFLQGLEV